MAKIKSEDIIAKLATSSRILLLVGTVLGFYFASKPE